MRKVSALELVSLDGVMESPEKWSFQFHNDEMEEANATGMSDICSLTHPASCSTLWSTLPTYPTAMVQD